MRNEPFKARVGDKPIPEATEQHGEKSAPDGFSVIELMVVVLVVGILLLAAIPAFLGARDRARDRAAQSNLRNALTTERILFTDALGYVASPASALTTIEPALNWVAGPGAGSRDVAAIVLDGNGGPSAPSEVILMAKSAAGTCFYLGEEGIHGATSPGKYYAASSGCAAPAALWGASPPAVGSRADPATAAWASSW